MKKNAFTLVELLGTMLILAIIITITAPRIISIITDSRHNLNTNQIKNIEQAARTWGTNNIIIVKNSEGQDVPNHPSVTLKQLQDGGYLDDKKLKNIIKKTNLADTSKVCITWENNQLNYNYKETGDC